MRGWRAAAIVVLAGLAAGIGVAAGVGSAPPQPKLAYVTGAAGGPTTVWVANADGTGARRLGPGSQPLPAPDGSLVAASTPSGLELYPSGGGSGRRYFTSLPVRVSPLAFSPNSRYLAVALSSTNPASAATSGLAVVDTRTSKAETVARGQIYGASFAPDASGRIVYATAPSAALTAPVDIHEVHADGSRASRITTDGRSLNPVWGRAGIAFDRERLRRDAEPVFALWLMAANGTRRRVLAARSVPPLREGLVPVGFSPDGRRLLADYVGQDTSQAWLLTLANGRGGPLGPNLTARALSRDGASALVERDGLPNLADHGVIESVPLRGGRPRVLIAHGALPSWNG